MAVFSVQTDAFFLGPFEAASLEAAIAEAFAGEIPGVKDEATLRAKMEHLVDDGGFVRIEEDGTEVLSIGDE